MSKRERGLVFERGNMRVRDTRYGAMLFNNNDAYIGRSLELYGEYSEAEAEIFRQMLSPGAVALDIGANIGAHTLSMAKFVGPEGMVYAFEPQRSVYYILCANLALNEVVNVCALQIGLGREVSKALAPRVNYATHGNFGGVSLAMAGSGDEVTVLTLDSMALPRCNLIKIDVEGMEDDVIAGAENTIRRLRPFMYVENDRKEKSGALIRRILDLNYRLYWHFPRIVTLKNFYDNQDPEIMPYISTNMLCVPRELPVSIKGREILSENDRPS
ncbi:Methyltransf_21 domain-containing protein [Azospirillaceae bacterium]